MNYINEMNECEANQFEDFLDKYLKMDPNAEVANFLKAYALFEKKEYEKALDVLHKLEKKNPKYLGAYDLAIQVEMAQGNFVAIKKEFQKAIDCDQFDNTLTQRWIQYCAMQGINQSTAQKMLDNLMIKSLEKRGKVKEAEQFKKKLGY